MGHIQAVRLFSASLGCLHCVLRCCIARVSGLVRGGVAPFPILPSVSETAQQLYIAYTNLLPDATNLQETFSGSNRDLANLQSEYLDFFVDLGLFVGLFVRRAVGVWEMT